MTSGSRHIQASPSLTLEFATTPTDYFRKPVPEIMFHFAWPFLDPPSIINLCVSNPVISCYGKLRAEASSLTAAEIHRIRTPLDHRTSTSSICSLRTNNVAKASAPLKFLPRRNDILPRRRINERLTRLCINQCMSSHFL